MDIHALPFNRFMGLRLEPAGAAARVHLEARPEYANHLGGVHVSAQFALAEAGCGQYLADELGARARECLALVRRAEARLRRPAQGALWARPRSATAELAAALAELETRGRALLRLEVDVADASGQVASTFSFEWFLRGGDGGGVEA